MRTTTMADLSVSAHLRITVPAACALALSACAETPPTGPSFAAMPGPGKTLEQFHTDDLHCRQTAPGQAGAQSGDLQRSYDIAYAQCMTAAGDKVPDVNTLPQYMPYYPRPYFGPNFGPWGWW